MRTTVHSALVVAVVLSGDTSSAQSLPWTQLAPATSPPVRGDHAMAYDATRQRVVLFGGNGTAGPHTNDTWEWDGLNWVQRTPVTSPAGRRYHSMAYDTARQRVVLFGGAGSAGWLNDTWEWNGTDWLQLTPAVSPSVRIGFALAYDAANQRVLLFGGYDTGSSVIGDTWTWDGTNWTQQSPSASPSARQGHKMAYDSARQRVVLFGGWTLTTFLADTWEWDGTSWLASFPANYPSARSWHAMAEDAARQRVVLFGGYGTSGSIIGDSWEWNGTNWMQLAPPVSPPPRERHALAYDGARQRVVLFGGAYAFGHLSDTWWLGPIIGPATATAYGSGCGLTPLGFVPDPSGRPLLGHVATATIVDAPTLVAAVAVGWSNQFFGPYALPVTLAGIGMPGCDLLQSADVLGLGTSPLTPSTLSYSLAIPNLPSLIGLHLYLQAYAFAPGVNPLQIIISNGIDWLLGNV